MIGKNLIGRFFVFCRHKSLMSKKIVEGRMNTMAYMFSVRRRQSPHGVNRQFEMDSSRVCPYLRSPCKEIYGILFMADNFDLYNYEHGVCPADCVPQEEGKGRGDRKHQKEPEKYAGRLELEVAKRTEELSSEKEILTIVSAMAAA